MPDDHPPIQPKKCASRWRRVVRWVGVLLLVALIFHRPLFHHGVRFVAIRGAATQGLKLDLRLSGSIFTNLAINGVRVEPTGTKPTPVRRIAIEHLRFDYSIPALVQHGVGEFLRSYAVRNAELELVALPSATETEKKEKRAIAEQLQGILAQPAAYADRVHIENFNVTVTAPESVTRVLGFHLLLDPEKIGHLRIARLEIPGIPRWENLAAETSYADRNLFIKELQLAPELVVEALNFDASRRAEGIAGMWIQLRLFGGTARLALSGTRLQTKGENLARSYDTRLELAAEGIALPAAARYFGAPPPPLERLAKLAVNFTGEPERPRTWNGDAMLRVEELAASPTLKVDAVTLTANFADGRARIAPVRADLGRNHATVTAEIVLPESVNDFARSEVDAVVQLDAGDLPALKLQPALAGALGGDGRIRVRDSLLDLQLDLSAQHVTGEGLSLGRAKVAVRATKRLDAPTTQPLAEVQGRIMADLSTLRVQTLAIDAASLEMEARAPLLTLHRLEVRRGDNAITAQGTTRLPLDLKDAARAPADVQFAVKVPRLADFGIAVKDAILAGRIDGRGSVKMTDGVPAGDIVLDGGGFSLGDFRAESLAAKVRVADRTATVEELALRFNAKDAITLSGNAGVAAPFPYRGKLEARVRDLAIFHPLLGLFDVKDDVAGGLAIDWSGQGDGTPPPAPAPPKHDGTLNVELNNARYGRTDLREFVLAAQYRPGFVETTAFRAQSGPTAVAAKISWQQNRLAVRELNVAQAGTRVLTGSLEAPLDPMAKPPVPMDAPIAADLRASDLDLGKLLASFGQTAPASGTLTASLVATGTANAPSVDLKVAGRRLKAQATPQLDPADLDLAVRFAEKNLTLDATLRQPQIQPLTVKGRIPLDVEALMQTKQLDPQLPLDVTARLPASSLAVVPKLSPQVVRIDGTAALDVRVAGTMAKPDLTGNVTVALKNARLANTNVPAIGAFDGRVTFASDTVRFERFRGEVGGGTFDLGGAVQIADPKNPVFDLRVRSDDVLVKRDESITVRADTDLRVTGPLKAGTVAGDVFVTQSRFFKEIDILPIGLPGRAPPPAPKTASTGPSVVSFPNPPIRDWKFDIAIRTRPNDSFLVRGNMANGAAALNLRLAGTGLEPYLDGNVRIEKFEASLPFSSLSITRGFVYFTKDAPFQPALDIQAESKTRDYTVGAYIHGGAAAPQIELTSNPPLDHADIVSLLATGTTTSELAGSADVLASRAAILAVQSLYRKIFRRGAAAPPPEKKADGSFLDRFEVELGAVDQRTGGREINTRYKVNDHYYLLGDLSTDGRFTGRLKYLIRFR
jgi:autotransporter translocation and assembly factor TamB